MLQLSPDPDYVNMGPCTATTGHGRVGYVLETMANTIDPGFMLILHKVPGDETLQNYRVSLPFCKKTGMFYVDCSTGTVTKTYRNVMDDVDQLDIHFIGVQKYSLDCVYLP